jgi:type III pantothenate kinase
MAHLVIDIGNSRTKFAIFHKRKLEESGTIEKLDTGQLNLLLDNHRITHSIISSVNEEISKLEDHLKERTKYIRFSASVKAGVINKYKSPETLGLDRFAGVIGAKSLFPDTNCLVIDAGTCITYDAVDNSRCLRRREYFSWLENEIEGNA